MGGITPSVIVVGNEKGGSGKSTVALHLVAGLMAWGLKAGAIDLDHRQQSLSHFFANRAHGLQGAWLPAVVQGMLSGLLTGGLKKTLEWLDRRMAGVLSDWSAFVFAPMMTANVILMLLGLIHTLIGTPELVATIVFPWSLSTLYAIVYNAGLVRARRSAA